MNIFPLRVYAYKTYMKGNKTLDIRMEIITIIIEHFME